MSRFLDAMRDHGKAGIDDEEPRTYRGTVVDAGEVLGSEDQLSLVDEESAQPHSSVPLENSTDTGRPRDPEPNHTRQQARTSAPVLQSGNDNFTDRAEGARGGDAMANSAVGPAQQNQPAGDNGYKEPRGFRPRLDPLFYLIIGIAAAGLFICLYALITQNDAYFEREYQQLQKESAALQARLAASAELQADLFAANQQALKNNGPGEVTAVDQSTEVDQQAAPLIAAQPQIIAPEVTTSEAPVTDGLKVETATEPQVTEPELVNAVEAAVEDPVSPAIVLLQQEVEALREALSRQEQTINRLERDNQELNTVRQPVNIEPPESAPVTDSASESRSKETQSAAPVEVERVAPVLSAQTDRAVTPVISQITPSLTTPLSNASEEVSDLIRQGYLAYQSKDYNASADYYGKALEFDPYSRDANLGVAAIAQLNGDTTLAEDRYRHLLTLDPVDEVAFSALLNLSGTEQGSIIEFELLQHVANIPDAPALYAVLGNYYSQQQRWRQASESYAVAVNRGTVNPDYLFNYAVSLDNEGLSARAADFYSQALTAINTEPFSFDAEAAERRLESLRPPE